MCSSKACVRFIAWPDYPPVCLPDSAPESRYDSVFAAFQVKITSALVHGARDCQQTNLNEAANDTGSIECLPEENVSIIESLEQREEKNLDLVGAVSVRRKLYFNPAYFEPELLMVSLLQLS